MPHYGLPDEYFLFVGTVEPRKNLRGLVAALGTAARIRCRSSLRAPRGGATAASTDGDGVRFLGFVPADDLGRLYGGADGVLLPQRA